MCTATTTSPEDPVVANQEERDAQDANVARSLQEEEKGRPHVAPFPGTIGLAGRITPGLRALITAWILLSQDENRIRVEPQGINLDTLLSSLGDSPQLIAHARLLHELELAESELVLINGRNCRGLPLESVQESLIMLEGDFSLVFIKPGGDQWLKRLVLLKLPMDSDTGNDAEDSNAASVDGSTNFWVDLNCEMNEVVTQVAPEEDDSSSQKVRSTQTIARPNTPEKFSRKELCLGALPDSPPLWLQTSPVLHGDQILEINGKTFIQELLPDDAQITISMLYQCDPACFSMVVKTPLNRRPVDTPAWRTNLRKTAVAVGGGVMVSAGAVLMVTPLHPIGHAMAIGGVGVLGTEFEQPRKAAQRAKDMAGNFHRSFHERRENRRRALQSSVEGIPPIDDEIAGQQQEESFSSLEDSSATTMEDNPVPVAPKTESRIARFLNRVSAR